MACVLREPEVKTNFKREREGQGGFSEMLALSNTDR